ncbi:MAG: endo alpha-1,4 polygalactosaminidase [Clostridia bacterium]|nr:endo alpha-1,4 polygalactosaminidase [Clostridia bacterium]
MKKHLLPSLILLLTLLLCGCGRETPRQYDYGVFLSAEAEDLDAFPPYRTVVLDAQYFTAEQIAKLKSDGCTVYSYINIGSIEDFRPYYNGYEDLTLGEYENWEEEKWVDVSSPRWQSFIADTLAPELLAKGIDGFFVDNCDVYYHYPTEEIFDGTAALLRALKATGAYVCVNGGDEFVTEYLDRFGSFSDALDAVNQETVFSKIEWEKNSFSANDAEERKYFQDYVETVAAHGGDVYLLEYTKDKALIEKINAYCEEKGFRYYVSGSIELTAKG